MKKLIIVCGHGIPLNGAAEADWLIEPFQAGETQTFVAHIEAGVRALAADPDSLLVFSGGATKGSGPGSRGKGRTEAEGYAELAASRDYFGYHDLTTCPDLPDRIFQDRFATDSFQNILCSLLQFPAFAAEYRRRRGQVCLSEEIDDGTTRERTIFPQTLTIVSHEFKRARFLDLHIPAVKFPVERVEYIGINPPFDAVKMAEIEEGDRKRGYDVWKEDLYGAGKLLAEKRIGRGWVEQSFTKVVLAHFDSRMKDVVESLMSWDGGKSGKEIIPDDLPWR